MQQIAQPRPASRARVVSLAEHRRRRARRPGRRTGLRVAVGLAAGVAIFGMMALFGVAASVALDRPHIGVPVGVAVATLASWQLSGVWMAQRAARRGRGAPPPEGHHTTRRSRDGAGKAGLTS